MKTYVLIISRVFPSFLTRKGEPTNFHQKIKDKDKIHTIRKNFPYWEKRILEVQKGNAILSIREWEGLPRKSKQRELFQLTKDDGVGIEKMEIDMPLFRTRIGDNFLDPFELSDKDGLELVDFEEWFASFDHSKPAGIIHFTPFRYNVEPQKKVV